MMVLIVAIFLVLSAANARAVEIFKIGELEIRLYESAEELQKGLPAHVTATYESLGRGMGVGITLRGWADGVNRTIYSVKDYCVLLHELKHILEPEWTHELFTTDNCAQVRVK